MHFDRYHHRVECMQLNAISEVLGFHIQGDHIKKKFCLWLYFLYLAILVILGVVFACLICFFLWELLTLWFLLLTYVRISSRQRHVQHVCSRSVHIVQQVSTVLYVCY